MSIVSVLHQQILTITRAVQVSRGSAITRRGLYVKKKRLETCGRDLPSFWTNISNFCLSCPCVCVCGMCTCVVCVCVSVCMCVYVCEVAKLTPIRDQINWILPVSTFPQTLVKILLISWLSQTHPYSTSQLLPHKTSQNFC